MSANTESRVGDLDPREIRPQVPAVYRCEQCRRFEQEMATAAIELVQLRARLLQSEREIRHLKVRQSALADSVCDAAEVRRVRSEMVREMTKGTCGHE